VVLLSLLLAACANAPAATTAPQSEEKASAPAEQPTEPPKEEAQPTEAPKAEQPAAEQKKTLKIGFLAGVQDPFYFTIQHGSLHCGVPVLGHFQATPS